MENSDSLRDDLLLLRCQADDDGAFEELVSRWQQPLLNYAYRLTGHWAAAQDAVQETWLVVIRGLVTLRDVARFRPWLFQIASHKCADHCRRNHRANRYTEMLRQETPESETPPPHGRRTDINAAFALLSPESRTVLALHYLQDFSLDEMAGILSLPAGTVKSRLFHARKQLKQIMEKDYGTI